MTACKYPLTKDQKTAWLKALRGGEFAQVQGALQTPKGFCCLGVLARCTSQLEEGMFAPAGASVHHRSGLMLVQRNCTVEPDSFHLLSADVQDQLTKMNDEGKSFAVIADWIEANVPVAPTPVRSRVLKNLRAHRAALMARANALLREGPRGTRAP